MIFAGNSVSFSTFVEVVLFLDNVVTVLEVILVEDFITDLISLVIRFATSTWSGIVFTFECWAATVSSGWNNSQSGGLTWFSCAVFLGISVSIIDASRCDCTTVADLLLTITITDLNGFPSSSLVTFTVKVVINNIGTSLWCVSFAFTSSSNAAAIGGSILLPSFAFTSASTETSSSTVDSSLSFSNSSIFTLNSEALDVRPRDILFATDTCTNLTRIGGVINNGVDVPFFVVISTDVLAAFPFSIIILIFAFISWTTATVSSSISLDVDGLLAFLDSTLSQSFGSTASNTFTGAYLFFACSAIAMSSVFKFTGLVACALSAGIIIKISTFDVILAFAITSYFMTTSVLAICLAPSMSSGITRTSTDMHLSSSKGSIFVLSSQTCLVGPNEIITAGNTRRVFAAIGSMIDMGVQSIFDVVVSTYIFATVTCEIFIIFACVSLAATSRSRSIFYNPWFLA
jgi:hypothetical protein